MKKSIFLSTILLVIAFTINAQNDTMYIMKNGAIVGKFDVVTEVDSIIFYRPIIQDTTTQDTARTFTDARDNTVYHWVQIGNQIWMAENLKYLPTISSPNSGSETSPYYYVYDYTGTDVNAAKATSNYTIYGVLYNWSAAMAGSTSSTANPSGVQGVCPNGWHLPSNAEWIDLQNYLADNDYIYDGSVVGGGLKIAKSLGSNSGWEYSSVVGAVGNTDYPHYINKSGFTALPGGFRGNSGAFGVIGRDSYFWCATESDGNIAWNFALVYNTSDLHRGGGYKEHGFSIRCVRD